ncbi:unnamed protein product [Penicillium salamii]|uniref:COX assembly mitochondrial protein n=1 Tax=Penicillium salamii TaxID=1612424 RepID=A0A9W4JG80_9EURO|nr:unnamed protein product [Penicillium salamii]CAG8388810.1 unnamed protein product [Penicillium salamii]CAG8392134.1 unnamed protein product [Penicillium salamii]
MRRSLEKLFFLLGFFPLRPSSRLTRAPHQHHPLGLDLCCQFVKALKPLSYFCDSLCCTLSKLPIGNYLPNHRVKTRSATSKLSDPLITPYTPQIELRSSRSTSSVPMTTPSTSSEASPTNPPRQNNLRNPLPLSAPQEQEVKLLYYKRVRSYCAPEIKAFAECAVNRTITATWVCRQQRLAMNSCMLAHAKPEEEDRAREEWFAGIEERRRARDEELAGVERRRAEVVAIMREDEARRKEKK